MATWKGDPKKFSVEVSGPANHWDESYGDAEFRWEYNTTSDCLCVYATHEIMNDPRQQEPTRYSKSWAEATLYTIANWYAIYEGRQNLKDLLKDLLEEEDGTQKS